MADPLSIVVNAATLLTIAGKTAQGLEKLLALRDAPKELRAVLNEVITPVLFSTRTPT